MTVSAGDTILATQYNALLPNSIAVGGALPSGLIAYLEKAGALQLRLRDSNGGADLKGIELKNTAHLIELLQLNDNNTTKKTVLSVSTAGVMTLSDIPIGPNSDPTTDNQLTRKLYVDGLTSDKSVSTRRTSTLSINNTTHTAVAFTAEDFDTDTMHDNATNNTRITFTTAGKYIIIANVSWASNATGIRQIRIRKNGTDDFDLDARTLVVPHSGLGIAQEVVTIMSVSATDYIELMVYQDSGGALLLESSPFAKFIAKKI
jgi:hypothetical protein